MGAQKGTGCTFKKPELIQRGVFLRHDIWENSQNLHKEVFHRTWYMVRKDKEEVRSSSVSICHVRPSAVPVGRKTSPNKGIHPAYPGYRSETPSQKIFFPLHSLKMSHVELLIYPELYSCSGECSLVVDLWYKSSRDAASVEIKELTHYVFLFSYQILLCF